ncbi:MAG: OmpA family protein [Bacteroidota bacterium]
MKSSFLIFTFLLVSLVATAQNQGPPYIKSIFFGGGDYYIDSQQKQELNDFLDAINGLEQYQIYVTSHTDSIGSIEYNQWLSQMRSSSVIKILEERGIPKEILIIPYLKLSLVLNRHLFDPHDFFIYDQSIEVYSIR